MRQARTASRFASRLYTAAAAALCASLLAGCASTAQPSPENAALLERANQYLAARQAGDVDTAYSLLAPSLRAVTSKEQFVGRHGEKNHMQGGDLHSIICENEHCVLQRNFTFSYNFPILSKGHNFSSYINELWIKEGYLWWLLLN